VANVHYTGYKQKEMRESFNQGEYKRANTEDTGVIKEVIMN
jgi:hypothetical protein